MSDVPTSKCEAKLHGAYFWIHGCSGCSKTQACTSGCWNFCMTSMTNMTMQTPPPSAFAKPFAIFFFSISNDGLPLEPLNHTFIGISNYPTWEDAKSTPLGLCKAICNFLFQYFEQWVAPSTIKSHFQWNFQLSNMGGCKVHPSRPLHGHLLFGFGISVFLSSPGRGRKKGWVL